MQHINTFMIQFISALQSKLYKVNMFFCFFFPALHSDVCCVYVLCEVARNGKKMIYVDIFDWVERGDMSEEYFNFI